MVCGSPYRYSACYLLCTTEGSGRTYLSLITALAVYCNFICPYRYSPHRVRSPHIQKAIPYGTSPGYRHGSNLSTRLWGKCSAHLVYVRQGSDL
jgi:hypothetical protein